MLIHVCRDGKEIGQYSRPVFDQLLAQDRLVATDHFWVEGMDEWKPLSLAKLYFGHPEKCRHCGGKMTEQKPINEGPRAGQTKSICLKCGHTEYHAGS